MAEQVETKSFPFVSFTFLLWAIAIMVRLLGSVVLCEMILGFWFGVHFTRQIAFLRNMK